MYVCIYVHLCYDLISYCSVFWLNDTNLFKMFFSFSESFYSVFEGEVSLTSTLHVHQSNIHVLLHCLSPFFVVVVIFFFLGGVGGGDTRGVCSLSVYLFVFPNLPFNYLSFSLLPSWTRWSPSSSENSSLGLWSSWWNWTFSPNASLCHLLGYILKLWFSAHLTGLECSKGLPNMILSKTINSAYRNFLLTHPFFSCNWLSITITSFPALPKSLSRHIEGFTTLAICQGSLHIIFSGILNPATHMQNIYIQSL